MQAKSKTSVKSGRFSLRIPRSLHEQLTREAATEGVSLNQICVSMLSQAVGRKQSEKPARKS